MWCKTCQGNISDWAAAVEHICPNVSALQDVVQLESLIRCPGKYDDVFMQHFNQPAPQDVKRRMKKWKELIMFR
jgi:hypothetical protein